MKRYLHITLILLVSVIALTLTCCERHTEAWQKMDLAENLMETQPDSSLVILNGISAESLGGKEESARYALLKSMALDKNYIDTTDFKVLQPAIDYYLKKGTPDEKLRTYYYQGRIYQNQGDDDSAMNSYVRALDFQKKASDSLAIARTLAAQSFIFYRILDYPNFISNRLEAANIFEKTGRYEAKYGSLISALDGALVSNNRLLADSILSVCEKIQNKTEKDESSLAQLRLIYAMNYENDSIVRKRLKSFKEISGDNLTELMLLGNAYQTIEEFDSALYVMKQVANSGEPYDSLKYEGLMTLICKGKGNYKESLEHYTIFNDLFSKDLESIYEQKIQTSEGRHKMELQAQKDADTIESLIWWSVVILLSVSLIVIALIYIARNNNLKKERLSLANEKLNIENDNLKLERDKKALEAENYQQRIFLLEHERDELLTQLTSPNQLSDEVRAEMKIRIEMLNGYLASRISDNDDYGRSYDKWVREIINDTERFMASTYKAFQVSHPEFIEYLRSHNLNEDEMKYVCLFAIGLRSKEVGTFLKRPSHVNMGTDIRKKLGLVTRKTQLSTFIRHLFDNGQPLTE